VKTLANKITDYKTRITEQDQVLFRELNHFLDNYNDEQKKAIISNAPQILCIAGAGSGKTTVLTKRIEFLVKYRGVDPSKILAITFTRKARQEMHRRLDMLDIQTHIHTFNSFSERILKLHGSKIYTRPTKTISYQNKVMLTISALDSIGLTINQATEKYYTHFQRISKTPEQLSHSFMNDCFSVLEYFKLKNKEIKDPPESESLEKQDNTIMIYHITKFLDQQMRLAGLRDFIDQLLDTISFFKQHPLAIPKFDYILIDEYQDVNSTQIELINLLNPKNIFCVGDPRQSIFGWRGSDLDYILNFKQKYSESEIISLTKNYRSNNHLVKLMNRSIKHLNLPDLEHNFEQEKQISLKKFDSEDEEFNFVTNNVLNSQIPKKDIFVLARTNRQLINLSQKFQQKRINYMIRTDEVKNPIFEKQGAVTLATIHSIKGLEAKKVFVIGCTEKNFPCKASDHPVIDLIKTQEYDKEEEEKRLFYVAISRAKNKLYLTYTGKKHTSFITDEMLSMIDDKPVVEEQTKITKPPKRVQAWKEKQNEYIDLTENKEEPENDFYKPDSTSDGSGYSNDYNPYKGEDWDEMVG
jgi:superfamily I DNA/RNA helicase